MHPISRVIHCVVPMLSPRTAVHFAALPPEYNEDLLNKMSTERPGMVVLALTSFAYVDELRTISGVVNDVVSWHWYTRVA